MNKEFVREERYIVFKVSDLGNSLKGDEIRRLAREYAEQRRLRGKKPLECVVVEKDWPEYEPTWRAIEARATGAQPAQKAVAYLDLGAGGYMDIGTDLTDEELDAIPKGRHMLGIVGTYGIDGYVPAQPAPSIVEQDRINAEAAIRSIYGARPNDEALWQTIVNGMITPAHIAQAVADGTITPAYIMQPAPSVPEGWQLVPSAESRHPGIYKMLGALHAADNTPGVSEWESYQAMLAEAPKPEGK